MPSDRRWSDADRELVRSALPVDPEDEGTIVVGYSWHEDGPYRYTVPVLGDPYEVVDRVLDALTADGWRHPPQWVHDRTGVTYCPGTTTAESALTGTCANCGEEIRAVVAVLNAATEGETDAR